jgi:hypothetical protein
VERDFPPGSTRDGKQKWNGGRAGKSMFRKPTSFRESDARRSKKCMRAAAAASAARRAVSGLEACNQRLTRNDGVKLHARHPSRLGSNLNLDLSCIDEMHGHVQTWSPTNSNISATRFAPTVVASSLSRASRSQFKDAAGINSPAPAAEDHYAPSFLLFRARCLKGWRSWLAIPVSASCDSLLP